MAYFTSDHLLNSDDVIVESCLIDSDIWMVRKLLNNTFDMYKFDTEYLKWKQIDYKNGHLFLDEMSIQDDQFYLLPSNNRMYMWRQMRLTTRLLELDILTLEWKQLIDVETDYFCPCNFFISNNKWYRLSYNEMIVTCLETWQVSSTALPDDNDVPTNIILCEENGKLFLISTGLNECRSVHQYDQEHDTFVELIKDVGKFPLNCRSTFVWSTENRIYQAVVGERMKIDYFDLKTRKRVVVFENRFPNCHSISKIVGTDKHIFITYVSIKGARIRIIDLDASLETITLHRLADKIVNGQISYNAYGLYLPLVLKFQLKSVVNWKKQDIIDSQPDMNTRWIMQQLEDLQMEDLYLLTPEQLARQLRRDFPPDQPNPLGPQFEKCLLDLEYHLGINQQPDYVQFPGLEPMEPEPFFGFYNMGRFSGMD